MGTELVLHAGLYIYQSSRRRSMVVRYAAMPIIVNQNLELNQIRGIHRYIETMVMTAFVNYIDECKYFNPMKHAQIIN